MPPSDESNKSPAVATGTGSPMSAGSPSPQPDEPSAIDGGVSHAPSVITLDDVSAMVISTLTSTLDSTLDSRLNRKLDSRLDSLDEKLEQKLDEKLDSKMSGFQGQLANMESMFCDLFGSLRPPPTSPVPFPGSIPIGTPLPGTSANIPSDSSHPSPVPVTQTTRLPGDETAGQQP